MTTWLIDKSAYTRLGDSPDAQEWADRIGRGMVRISTIAANIGRRPFPTFSWRRLRKRQA